VKWLVIALLFGSASMNAQTADACGAFEHSGKTAEATRCWSGLARSQNALERAQALFGLEQYDDANEAFREAERQQPRSAVIKTEWGKLFAARAQPGDAAKLFQEAIALDANYAPAYLELARTLAENYDKAAVELTHKALEHDPKLYQAHEFLAYLALEDSDRNAAESEAKQALAQSPEALDAMAVLSSIDWLDGKPDSTWMEHIRQTNPKYGEAYATGAHFLIINRRYEEGIALYRKALELKPHLWAARGQLGINLMRTGDTAQAREQLQQCFAAHYSDAQIRNALRFLDRLPEFQEVNLPGADLLLNKKEAPLLAPYFSTEVEHALAAYERKYQMKLPGPVRVEVFPNHDDFAVRTLGLPGQGGLLGVTFGSVVAMDSPSARPPGDIGWAETLWHEMSHVYLLTATHNLVPRWFTEGVAVHEERASAPAGSDRTTPLIVAAVKQGKLLPVLQLERGFVRPEYDGQVLVSYFEAGRMCDYIVDRWGDGAIAAMVHSFAARKTTGEAIEASLHVSADEFDRQFRAWLPSHTPAASTEPPDWNTLKQRAGNNPQSLERLNYMYLEDADVHRRLGGLLLTAGDAKQAIREFQSVIALRPDDTAQAHYDLARALNAAHDNAAAKEQVLAALETAPNFKPAQQLLIQLSQ
jgi:cellulose synthase operon protein C